MVSLLKFVKGYGYFSQQAEGFVILGEDNQPIDAGETENVAQEE
ncbi:hypothetical protein [Larkinella rosea]|nr:hypothetical protein [Larkinella rosea]